MNLAQPFLPLLLAWLAVALPAGIVCAVLWLSLPEDRRRLLPQQRTAAAPWSGLEVLFVFLLWWAMPVSFYAALTGLFGEPSDGERHFLQYLAVVLACPVFLAVGLLFLHVVSGTQPYQLGIHGRRPRQALVLGLLAWLPGSLLIHLVNMLVGWLVEQVGPPPEPHTLLKVLEVGRPELGWALLLASALLVAPLVEEFLFRGVILRWATRSSGRAHVLMLLAVVLTLLNTHQKYLGEGVIFCLISIAGYSLLPPFFARRSEGRGAAETNVGSGRAETRTIADNQIAATARGFQAAGVDRPPAEAGGISFAAPEAVRPDVAAHEGLHGGVESVSSVPDVQAAAADELAWKEALRRRADEVFNFVRRKDRRANDMRAVYAAAFLFASAHPWPTPAALLLLGLLLGWLALRTQSLLAPVFVHFLFNAISVVMLALEPLLKTATP